MKTPNHVSRQVAPTWTTPEPRAASIAFDHSRAALLKGALLCALIVVVVILLATVS